MNQSIRFYGLAKARGRIWVASAVLDRGIRNLFTFDAYDPDTGDHISSESFTMTESIGGTSNATAVYSDETYFYLYSQTSPNTVDGWAVGIDSHAYEPEHNGPQVRGITAVATGALTPRFLSAGSYISAEIVT